VVVHLAYPSSTVLVSMPVTERNPSCGIGYL
jgi:hypothetical protein